MLVRNRSHPVKNVQQSLLSSRREVRSGNDDEREHGHHRSTSLKDLKNMLRTIKLGPAILFSAFLVLSLHSLLKRNSLSFFPDAFTNRDADYDKDGPPADLVVHGERETYAKVPATSQRLFLAEGKAASHAIRAFHHQGWTQADKMENAHIYHRFKGIKGKNFYTILQPWQRYSRVPGIIYWENKDRFLSGFRRYQQKNPDEKLHFLPETYILTKQSDREAFQKRLDSGGRNRPWVLKQVNLDNGQGIEMLGPNSEALDTAADRAQADKDNVYIVQAYICNELTWLHGEKFDLRFFWLVASVDPLIVLYHDGYVRVGAASYNETDFSSTGQHLTNHNFRGKESEENLKEYLWKRIREHYDSNRKNLSRNIRIDPVQHVRKQMKEALGTFIAAFKDLGFASNLTRRVVPENLFGFYGADFVIDNDLDVYFIEAQSSPGIPSFYDYKIDFFRELFRPMVDIVEEISQKQEADAKANILPLEKLGGWEVVYAGDWQYRYQGYERSTNKQSCSTAMTTAQNGRRDATGRGLKTEQEARLSPVEIAEGKHKYVLIRAISNPNGQQQDFVTSRKDARFHKNAAEPMIQKLKQAGYSEIEVVGGGRMSLDESSKKISIFGYSNRFGQANHTRSMSVVLGDPRYRDFQVLVSNDGY